MKFNLSEIQEIIEERRTIKPEQFSDRKVHKEIIEKMLNAAKWAPTHRLTQPWRFTVFTNDGLRKLGELHANLYKELADEDSFSDRKYQTLLHRPQMSSACIAIALKRDEQERVPFNEELASVAIAVQNMSLVATAYGIGTYWATGGKVYSPEMKVALGYDENDSVLGLLYVGYPEREWPRKTPRKPIEYFTTWVDSED
ncbi:MAG: nitroreductase [Crocinitomicaceae bacterium]|nr:nitroreductase [Crocinitomicaceae bacterium]|tara:strand:+ start:13626 stop:14222 length:597 start_codon:yes stop_codon:yes gene_type:complete